MSAIPIKSYQFSTGDQWRACLIHGFDPGRDGTLNPATRFGLHPAPIAAPAATAIAVDHLGGVQWRISDPHAQAPRLMQLDAFGAVAGPFEIDTALAESPRWLLDRHWLWAFKGSPARLRRYDRETLQLDLSLGGAELGADAVLLDMAPDGEEGVWLLARLPDGSHRLVRVDCHGAIRAHRRPPAESGPLRALTIVAGGATFILLQEDGRAIWVVQSDDRTAPRKLDLRIAGPTWTAERIASDGRTRFVLLGREGQAAPTVCVFDASADLIEGPLDGLSGDAQDRIDIAIGDGNLWLARADGLWRLDSSEASGQRESSSVLLTPMLDSPPFGDDRGWLRAEIMTELPIGAVLAVAYASTSDRNLAGQVRRIAADGTLTQQARQDRIWRLLAPPAEQELRITGPTAKEQPVAFPLFESQDRWLWLRISVTTPPGTPPPVLTRLRVLYPDFSLVQYLPAIFRGPKNDPRGFLRRLVGVLEVTSQGLDEKIRGIGRNIDPDTAPDEWLDYLAGWLDLPWDSALPEAAKRCILRHAAVLQRGRGTRNGLERLLRCLVGASGSVAIRDDTVDRDVIRLGGAGCPGAALPALIAGMSDRVAAFNHKAALGRVRLSCSPSDCDPLRVLAPGLRIVLTAPRDVRLKVEPLVGAILRQFIPAGLGLSIGWRTRPAALAPQGDGEILDGNGPGILGSDSALARTVLAGRGANRISETGLDLGFRL
ncbi:phage tail protein [Dongia sp.]|uniref:phage tail protein n=1 Tax=Dongia sp. TaxID=1977262 RepID=UPI0037537DE5